MAERKIIWSGLGLLLLTMLACNAFAGRPQPGLPPVPTASSVPMDKGPIPGDLDLAPTVTLPVGSQPSPDTPYVTILVDLNVRSGPGVQFRRVGFLLGGNTVTVLGRDPDSGWWQIECSPDIDNDACWVSGGAAYTRPQSVAPVATATP